MLAPTAERIGDALAHLSADDRALLELSLRRGVSDDEIAALLHVHREHVEHRREIALERLAEDLDAGSRAEVAALVGQSLRSNGGAAAPQSAATPRRAADLPASPHAARRARRRTALIAAAAVAAAIAALAIALSGGGDDEPEPNLAPAQPAPAPPADGVRVDLTPVASQSTARATAQLRGSRLRLRLRGLPAGSYAVWLFNDVSNATRVARFQGPEASLEATLPKGFRSYRTLDVSREPADGNPNHSGASVLRAPIAELLGR